MVPANKNYYLKPITFSGPCKPYFTMKASLIHACICRNYHVKSIILLVLNRSDFILKLSFIQTCIYIYMHNVWVMLVIAQSFSQLLYTSYYHWNNDLIFSVAEPEIYLWGGQIKKNEMNKIFPYLYYHIIIHAKYNN